MTQPSFPSQGTSRLPKENFASATFTPKIQPYALRSQALTEKLINAVTLIDLTTGSSIARKSISHISQTTSEYVKPIRVKEISTNTSSIATASPQKQSPTT